MIILGTNSIKDTGSYQVDNSLRFDDGSTDYLNRTLGTPTNNKKWTYSAWLKKSSQTDMIMFSCGANNNDRGLIYFNNSGDLNIYGATSGSTTYYLATNRLFRDNSAWYNIVISYDSTQATSTNRIKIYVNGVQETSLSQTTYPAENHNSYFNSAIRHDISGRMPISSDYLYNGYMAEVCFIDGLQLTPTSFGEFDEDSGIWKPIDVSGLTFGTNGFYLDFEDSSALGNDANGSNNFTVNNLTAIDQSVSTCTNNEATLNPLNSTGNGTEPTYSEGNLQSVSPSSGGGFVGSSTIGVSSGKWFFELQRSAGSSTNIYIGIGDEKQTSEIARQSASAVFIGNAVYYKPDDGNKIIVTNGSGAETSYGATYGNGDKIGIALNMDDNQVTFYKNGASQGVISIPTPDGFCFLNIVNGADTADTFQINFGSPPYSESGGNSDGNGYGNYSMSVPSGYFSLNTKNLAEYG